MRLFVVLFRLSSFYILDFDSNDDRSKIRGFFAYLRGQDKSLSHVSTVL